MKKGYKTYRFDDQDPILDDVLNAINDSGASYTEVAAISGVSLQTLYNWANGTTTTPRTSTLIAVARAVGADVKIVRRVNWRG